MGQRRLAGPVPPRLLYCGGGRLAFGRGHIHRNLARLGLFGFGDKDVQHAMIKAGFNGIAADIDRETQAAGELAAAAFAD